MYNSGPAVLTGHVRDPLANPLVEVHLLVAVVLVVVIKILVVLLGATY